jgi:hypothetical protein
MFSAAARVLARERPQAYGDAGTVVERILGEGLTAWPRFLSSLRVNDEHPTGNGPEGHTT